MKVLDSKQGMFGPISIIDREGQRQLLIGAQNQGGSVLVNGTPGPIGGSSYLTGWLVAGSQNPESEGLMVGLGSGAGAVALLYCFPDMRLTVVEIDPMIIRLATKHFPLVEQYQDEGRLRIVNDDASDFLAKALEQDDQWDVGYADAYQGSNDIHLPEQQIMGLAGTCDHVWFNMIETAGGPKVKALQKLMRELECPLVASYDANPDYSKHAVRNLILTTQKINPETADAFVPYEDLDSDEAGQAVARYIELLGSEKAITQG